MRRTQKSFINVMTSLLTNAVFLVTAFIVQKTLIATKGPDYNSINGLFSNIISMMSLADLGLGTAIIYHMYRPVAEKDEDKINSLLHFYKKCYLVISGIVLLIGAVVALFLPMLVGDAGLSDNVYVIYALFLADCICSYFFVYKKSLLYADLKNYIPDAIYFVTYIIQNALQITALVVFDSFILFLIVKTLGKIVPNIFVSLYIAQKYPFTRAKQVMPVEKEIKQDIFIKIKGLFYHKLGKIVVTGSDSIVLTGVLGLGAMNLYTNYYLVISGIRALLVRIFEILTNSVGNFLLDSNEERNLDVYKKVDFINFWCFGLAAAGMYGVMQPLITLWLGEEFLFGKSVLLVLVINFYLDGMRASVNTFKEAAGIFHEDRRIPVIEAIVNLGVSIVLAYFMGAAGVFLGTIISMGVAYLYSYPKYVCKPLMNMSYGSFVGNTGGHLAVLLIVLGLMEVCTAPMSAWSPWAQFMVAGVTAIVIFHLIFLPIYGRSQEFRFCIELLKGKVWSK